MTLVEEIARHLQQQQPRLLCAADKQPAAVAMVLAGRPTDPQLLFIERANHPQDPWSGNLAFPGGRVDPDDHSPRAAAEREAREELGLNLRAARYLGQLDDIAGAYLPVQISCFIYHFDRAPKLHPNHEVHSSFWFDFVALSDPHRHGIKPFFWQGAQRQVHAIDLLGPERPVLWGITYRLVIQLLTRMGKLDPQLAAIADD